MTGYSVATDVRGDVDGLRREATWLITVSTAAELVERNLADILRLAAGWQGTAADRGRAALTGLHDQTTTVATGTKEIGLAVGAFADGLAAALAGMARARQAARAAGYPTTADAIHFPMAGGPCVVTPGHAAVTTLVDQARLVEAQAHEALNRVLARHVSFIDHLVKGLPTRGLSTSASVFTRIIEKTQVYTRSAGARARMASAAAALAEHPAASPALRTSAMSELARRLPGVIADRQAQQTAKALSFAPVSATEFTKAFKLSGGLFGVAGAGWSMANGTPPAKAIGSAAAGYVASSATMGVAAAIGLAAGPPGWVALGLSVVIGAGVGYAVDHYWEDLADLVDND